LDPLAPLSLLFGGDDRIELTLERVTAAHQLLDAGARSLELAPQCPAQPVEMQCASGWDTGSGNYGAGFRADPDGRSRPGTYCA
jgi:hypothetical protein